LAERGIQHCSLYARKAGDDPGASAWASRRFLICELALPWPTDPLDSSRVPRGLTAAIDRIYERGHDIGTFCVAPDPDYAVPELSRIFVVDFPDEPKSGAVRWDVLVPPEQMAETVLALAEDTPLPVSASVDETPYRDIMVCTHGSRDTCCATFGFPIYRTLRALSRDLPTTRVWRASHFGGHRFAPTLVDLPDGRCWGFLDNDLARAILFREGNPAALRGQYRGWKGYAETGLQLLEREAFLRVGWDWLSYRQEGRVVSQDSDGQVREIAIAATSPAGESVEYRGEVEQLENLVTMGSCNDEPISVPRFRLTAFAAHALVPAGNG
jgi:hypothetical protein